MSVVLPNNLVFLASPRTASSATRTALLNIPGARETRRHHQWPDVNEDTTTFFTTIRNHYDACSSWYAVRGPHYLNYDFDSFVEKCDHSNYAKGCRLWWQFAPYCSHVLRYESLQEDLDTLLKRYDLPTVKLPIENVTKNKKIYKGGSVWKRFQAEMLYYGYNQMEE